MNQKDREDIVITCINELAHECNKNAEEHGFWEDEDKLLSLLCNDPSCIDKFHTLYRKRVISLFNSEKIVLEHSELSERLETLRNQPTKLDEHCPEFYNIEIECADLIIRCLD